jgi:hypothetical protein
MNMSQYLFRFLKAKRIDSFITCCVFLAATPDLLCSKFDDDDSVLCLNCACFCAADADVDIGLGILDLLSAKLS